MSLQDDLYLTEEEDTMPPLKLEPLEEDDDDDVIVIEAHPSGLMYAEEVSEKFEC